MKTRSLTLTFCLAAHLTSFAATFTVTNTGDSGPGSLRQAILDANATPGLDSILFAIAPFDGSVKTILITNALATITDPLAIDGYTQIGASANTLVAGGSDAVLLIELLTTNSSPGLIVDAPGGKIAGLALNGFTVGVTLLPTAPSNIVEGCFIGLAADGTNLSSAVTGIGVDALGAGNLIGGNIARARNVIGNCSGAAIHIANALATGNAVQGNLIGTDRSGITPMGNALGVLIEQGASLSMISGNLIGFSGGAGVAIASGTGNTVLGNSIYVNGQPGIDLDNDGPTANDAGDPDAGANNLQNYPDLQSAVATLNGTDVTGLLNSEVNTTYWLEFYSNPVCDTTGRGPGVAFLGAFTVTTDGNGFAPFTFPLPPVGPFDVITATATDPGGNTSEFSGCVPITTPTTDLAVSAAAVPNPVSLGLPLDVTVTVANIGNTTATQVILTNLLPGTLTLFSAAPSQGTCTNIGGTTICALGDILAATQATVTLTAFATTAGTANNTSTVHAVEDDSNPADNTAALAITVSPGPCATALSDSVALRKGKLTANLRTKVWQQKVRIRNNSDAPLPPRIYLIVDSLTPGITVIGATGVTTCAGTHGSPYVEVDFGDFPPGPGQSTTVPLTFTNPSGKCLTFTPLLFGTPGAP